jgi:hypothetical protein
MKGYTILLCLRKKKVLEGLGQTTEHENHALEEGACWSPGEKTLGERREGV